MVNSILTCWQSHDKDQECEIDSHTTARSKKRHIAYIIVDLLILLLFSHTLGNKRFLRD